MLRFEFLSLPWPRLKCRRYSFWSLTVWKEYFANIIFDPISLLEVGSDLRIFRINAFFYFFYLAILKLNIIPVSTSGWVFNGDANHLNDFNPFFYLEESVFFLIESYIVIIPMWDLVGGSFIKFNFNKGDAIEPNKIKFISRSDIPFLNFQYIAIGKA